MPKVFLGVGHGGKDPGAVGYIKEADVNLNMALACTDYLVSNGVEVKMSRTRDENDDLNEEIRECNTYNPDLAVDIHNNAGGADGFEVYHSIFRGKGTILAQNIEKEVIAIGQNSRGCKSRKSSKGNYDYYGFIRDTKAPAVICEGVFVDNKADSEQADTLEEQKAFGVAYAKGIMKTLGIEEHTPATDNVVEEEEEIMKIYQNGSTQEIVYADTNCTVKIGSLDPREKCDCFGEFNNRAMVRYKVNGTNNYKIGFCKWLGGIR